MDTSLTTHYDQQLKRLHLADLPEGTLLPRPSSDWPAENILLLEEFHRWLVEGGTGAHAIENIHMPAAGLILGLNLKPQARLNLVEDMEKVMTFIHLCNVSATRIMFTRYGMDRFKRFLRWKRGLSEVVRIKDFDVAAHTRGLPEWLVQELVRYQHIMQKNWRPSRLHCRISNFWNKHLRVWKYLCFEKGVKQLSDLKRRQITDMMARDVRAGFAVNTINTCVIMWKGFLAFLLSEGYEIPPSLLLVKTLKQPELLPQYLHDDEMIRLREAIDLELDKAQTHYQQRNALLLKAAFYLLWHGGLRLGEVEDLLLEDVDLDGKRLTVRNGKGQKDRTIYLTTKTIQVIREYLPARGPGNTNHLLLYNYGAMKKDLIRERIRSIGRSVGLKVNPHRLRHSTATQLLNAGCRITSIQKILGHKKLDTTLRYARAYDETVAGDFYAAMERVEQRLAIEPVAKEEKQEEKKSSDEVVNVQNKAQVLFWIERLADQDISHNDRQMIAASLKQALFKGSMEVVGASPG